MSKLYWINEGRHFDISDKMREAIVSAGFQFYHRYECTGICKYAKKIWLLDSNGEEHELPYCPDVYVH
jgi:hypothetical protein